MNTPNPFSGTPSFIAFSPMNQEPLPVCLDKSNGGEFFDEIRAGRFTRVSFHRTLRIPEDGNDYPLPAGLGRFPIHRVEDYAEKVPAKWLEDGGFFIPLYQKEALFLQFDGPEWHPTIAKVCVGRINAISGKPYSEILSRQNQDYVVIPNQRWLDGIFSEDGLVKQFVAMPLGQGYTIEAQITDEERFGGFQVVIMDAVDSRFSDRNPRIDWRIQREEEAKRKKLSESLQASPLPADTFDLESLSGSLQASPLPAAGLDLGATPVSMGIAAGGSIKQQIHRDTYGIESWNPERKRSLTIHLVNSLAYKAITGMEPPPSPITAAEYKRANIPWFSHYDESAPALKPQSILKKILSVSTIEKQRGIVSHNDIGNFIIRAQQVHRIRTPDKNEASNDFRKRAKESQRYKWWEAALREISYVIDLGVDVTAEDYALRSSCNYHLGRFKEGSIDATLGLEDDSSCVEALTWRAYCRQSLAEHDLLYIDAIELIKFQKTELLGLELSVEAALHATLFDEVHLYTEAINNARTLKKKRPNYKKADELISALNMKFCGRDWGEDHGVQ
jgi:hypothetical protein